jgi:predicted DNA-binding transcriptional regulator AlpA
MSQSNDVMLPGPRVQERYQVSAMTVSRWEKDPRLHFPEPVRINRRKYWRLADLLAWERARAGRAA